MRIGLRQFLGAMAWVMGATLSPAQDVPAPIPVDIQLSLLVDVSESVDASEFELQRKGYVEAFRDPAIIAAIQSGQHRKVAVNLIYWSSPIFQRMSVPWTLLSDAASANGFADAIQATKRPFTGNTAIGSAIRFSLNTFKKSGFESTLKIMDISGDGIANCGISPKLMAQFALKEGITTINGIAIDPSPDSSLKTYYEKNVIAGKEAFAMAAESFERFPEAIKKKLLKELPQPPAPAPEPPAPTPKPDPKPER